MRKPAGQGLRGILLVAWRDIEKRGSAGSAVQIFVAATDREIRLGDGEVERNGSGRVGQISER